MNQFLRKAPTLVAGVLSLAILSSCGGDDNNNNDALLLLALQPPASGSNPTIVGSPAAVTTARGATLASSSAGSAASQAAGVSPTAMQAELMASMAQIKAAAQPAAVLSWDNQQIDLPVTDVTCYYMPGATTMASMVGVATAQGKLAFRAGSKIVMKGTYDLTSTGSYPNTSTTLDANYTMASNFVVDFTECGLTAFDVNSLAAWDGKYTTIPIKSLVITGDVTFSGTSTNKQQLSSSQSQVDSLFTSSTDLNSQFSSEFASSSTSMKVADTAAGLASATASTSSLTGSGSGTQVTKLKQVLNGATVQELTMLMDWSTTETVKGTVNGENVEITIPITLKFSCSSADSCTQ